MCMCTKRDVSLVVIYRWKNYDSFYSLYFSFYNVMCHSVIRKNAYMDLCINCVAVSHLHVGIPLSKCQSLSHIRLCDPMDYSLPGSSVLGILQARILEWVTISFSRGSSWPRDQIQFSCIEGRFFTLWTTMEAQQRPGVHSVCSHRATWSWNETCFKLESFVQTLFCVDHLLCAWNKSSWWESFSE